MSWTLHPVLLLGLVVFLVAGLTRAEHRGRFFLGWGALVVAFVSPLCAMTIALFSARAAHHLLILSVAAPLLALGLPLRPKWGGLSAPAAMIALALVLWHLPAVYSASFQSTLAYWALQLLTLLPAWVSWSHLLKGEAAEPLLDAAMIGSLAGVMGLIGAVLTFAPNLLYPEHLLAPYAWGIDPLADQQLAGLIMWVPGLVPLVVLTGLRLRHLWQRAAAR